MNVFENLESLLNHYNITVRFNLDSNKMEITIPDKTYSRINEDAVKLIDILALCILHKVPRAYLQRRLSNIADKNCYSPG
jgi:hypothetical protein